MLCTPNMVLLTWSNDQMFRSTSTGTFKGDIRFSKTEKSVGGLSADPKQSF